MQPIYLKAKARTKPNGARSAERLTIGLVAGLFICTAMAGPHPVRAQATALQPHPCPPPLGDRPADESLLPAWREALAERRRLDWPGLCRHRDANAALQAAAVDVVFIGDSITEFWSGAAPELFTGAIVNRGIGAQTSPQMLVRFHADVIALRPRAVHIMAGTNDLAGNTGPSRPEDFKNNIRAMTEIAQANGVTVIIGAIPPAAAFPWRPTFQPAGDIEALNGWLRDYAGTKGALFVDYHAAMSDPAGAMRPELTDDGVHPDADGYGVMTPLAISAIRAAIPGWTASRP